MGNRNGAPSLQRCFGIRETITINVGTVVGVGLFTMGANVVGLLGSGVFWATLLALGVSIYPALLYAEMGGALPYAGGTYQYASLGLGRPFGVLAGWNFVVSMVSVASGEALAFAFYLRTLFETLGCPFPSAIRPWPAWRWLVFCCWPSGGRSGADGCKMALCSFSGEWRWCGSAPWRPTCT